MCIGAEMPADSGLDKTGADPNTGIQQFKGLEKNQDCQIKANSGIRVKVVAITPYICCILLMRYSTSNHVDEQRGKLFCPTRAQLGHFPRMLVVK